MGPRHRDRQTLLWQNLTALWQNLTAETNAILDIGCGTGLLAIASEPFLGDGGRYVGLDIMSQDIAFCREHHPAKSQFRLVDAKNAFYVPGGSDDSRPWDLDDNSFDMVTALSVWTHIREEDARFHMKEVRRVRRPGGKALITMFVLDESYEQSLALRSSDKSRYYMTFGSSIGLPRDPRFASMQERCTFPKLRSP